MSEEFAKVVAAIQWELSERGPDPNLMTVSTAAVMSVGIPNPDGSQFVWEFTHRLGTRLPSQLAADFVAAYRAQRGQVPD